MQVDLIDPKSLGAKTVSGENVAYLMTIVDHASKMVMIIPLPSKSGDVVRNGVSIVSANHRVVCLILKLISLHYS